uniref:Putative ecdysteroid kinase n=1 Tax=Culex tarsalis TaxID=7177 RepID=A0A1Q3FQ71_CULTA
MDHLITIAECAEVVQNSNAVEGSFDVVSYRFERVGGQPGYLGEYAHLIISVKKDDDEIQDFRYFVKCLPMTDMTQRKIIEEVGIFTKEAVCYREMFPKFEQSPEKVLKWRPFCWLARDDLMVMEDLVDNGFEAMPYRKEFGQEHMLRIIDSMAQMHACCLDLEINQMNGTKIEDKYGSMLFETTFMKESTWFLAGLQGIKKAALCASKYSKNPSYKQTIEAEMDSKMDRIFQLIEPTTQYRSVVVHRDLWFNNFMFRFPTDPSIGSPDYDKPSSCVLLDFQIARYLPPAVDFLCAIFLLTRRSHRDQFYESYVEHYYKTLTDKLGKLNLDIKTILPRDQFRESLEHYRLVGLLWSGVLHAFVNLPEGYLHDLRINHPQTYYDFCLVSRDNVIQEFLNKDSYYRDNLLDTVDETLEYLFEFK